MNPKLSHLSAEQQNTLRDDYLLGKESVAALISKYKIDTKPSELVSLFPPVVHEDSACVYCSNEKLISNHSTREPRYHECAQYRGYMALIT